MQPHKFAFSVARYLEEQDSSLTPVPELKPLYPRLSPEPLKEEELPRSCFAEQANQSDYASAWTEESDFVTDGPADLLQSSEPTAPPPDILSTTSPERLPPKNPECIERTDTERNQSNVSGQRLTRVVETVVVSSIQQPSERTIIVNNNNNNIGEILSQYSDLTEKNPVKKDDDEEETKVSKAVAAALLTAVAVGTTVGSTKVLLAQRRLQKFREEAKDIESNCETKDFLEQFHKTFGAFRTRDRIYGASVLSGGLAAAIASSLYYFDCRSDSAYFPLIGIGCGSVCAAAFSYMWYNSETVSESRKLHSLCKNLCQKAQ